MSMKSDADTLPEGITLRQMGPGSITAHWPVLKFAVGRALDEEPDGDVVTGLYAKLMENRMQCWGLLATDTGTSKRLSGVMITCFARDEVMRELTLNVIVMTTMERLPLSGFETVVRHLRSFARRSGATSILAHLRNKGSQTLAGKVGFETEVYGRLPVMEDE